MSEELKIIISCLLLKFEYKHLSFNNFKKDVDSLILNSDETELIEMSLASTENELAFEAQKVLKHNLHPKAFLVLISSILTNNSSKDLLKRVADISKYQYSPLLNGQHLSEYYTENKLLEECVEFFYWSWDELHLSRVGILGGLKDFESHLLELIKLLQCFSEKNIKEWSTIELKVGLSIKSITKDRLATRL